MCAPLKRVQNNDCIEQKVGVVGGWDTTTAAPSTTTIVHALKSNEMSQAFRYASPGNRENIGNDLNKFEEMVKKGPYRFLVRHLNSEILMINDMHPSTKRFLVRTVPGDDENRSSNGSYDDDSLDDEKDDEEDDEDNGMKTVCKSPVHDYWWILSRAKRGPDEGCYMVDAVIPNS